MCVYSFVADHFYDKWRQPPYQPAPPPEPLPYYPSLPLPAQPVRRTPTKEEIDEFYDLLRKAREYDKRNNEPDCELQEKKDKLLALAEELGISIAFPHDEPLMP